MNKALANLQAYFCGFEVTDIVHEDGRYVVGVVRKEDHRCFNVEIYPLSGRWCAKVYKPSSGKLYQGDEYLRLETPLDVLIARLLVLRTYRQFKLIKYLRKRSGCDLPPGHQVPEEDPEKRYCPEVGPAVAATYH